MGTTRWQALFDDLEAQAALLADAEQRGEVAERTRLERSRLALPDRLLASAGHPLSLRVLGAGTVAGVLADAGPDWLLVLEGGQRDLLIPLAAVQTVAGVGQRSAPPTPPDAVTRRLDLRWALRGLARSRSPVALVLADGSGLSGTLDQVGADHVDLAEHAPGEARRAAEVRQVRVVPLAALALVRSS